MTGTTEHETTWRAVRLTREKARRTRVQFLGIRAKKCFERETHEPYSTDLVGWPYNLAGDHHRFNATPEAFA
jgi:hypothetical protein